MKKDIKCTSVMEEEILKRMKKLEFSKKIIDEFQKENKLKISKNIGVLCSLEDTEKKIVEDFEKEYGFKVYHVIKTNTSFGLCYSLLYVSDTQEEWVADNDDLIEGYAYVYVFNADYPSCSEFGSIGIKCNNGGLIRTK